MSKAQTLASTVSTGGVLADGTVAYAEVTGTPTNSATATSIAGGSNGTIPYQSAADTTAMLAAGTAGQVLQTNGAAAPTWVTPAGGATVLLSTVTASASTTVDIEDTFNSTYDAYMIVVSGLTIANNNNIGIRMKIGGSYLSTSTYKYHTNQTQSNNPNYYGANSETSNFIDLGSLSAAAGCSADLVIYIHNPTSTTLVKKIHWTGLIMADTLLAKRSAGVGLNTVTNALTGIRLHSNQNLSGIARLYGIVNS